MNTGRNDMEHEPTSAVVTAHGDSETPTEPAETPVPPAPKRKPGRPKLPKSKRHGLRRVRRALREHGLEAIDRRTQVGKALAELERDLIDDLGGPDALSTQRRTLVSVVVRTRCLLDSIDVWALTQDSVINKRARKLFPWVLERQRLADSLVRQLEALGFDRQRAEKRVSASEYAHGGQP